jgi:GLPGLI family protein
MKKNNWLLLLALVSSMSLFGQIHSGTIQYERKTNLHKKYPDMVENFEKWEVPKIKTDLFTLNFNDTLAHFGPSIDATSSYMSYWTRSNSYLDQLNTKKRLIRFDVSGEYLFVEDTLPKRNWKITDQKRMIANYNCRKAIWQKDDTTRIYAWFTEAIFPEIGPEGITGLPGAILGLATEDGSVVYFAQSVESKTIEIEQLQLPVKRKNVMTLQAFKEKITKIFENSDWGKGIIKDLLRWM